MTETNMILSNPYHGERRAGFVGLPLPGVEVRAVPEENAEASHDSGAISSDLISNAYIRCLAAADTSPSFELLRVVSIWECARVSDMYNM